MNVKTNWNLHCIYFVQMSFHFGKKGKKANIKRGPFCDFCCLTSGSSPWWCRPRCVGRSSVGGIKVPAKSKRACMAYRDTGRTHRKCWLKKHNLILHWLQIKPHILGELTFLVPFLLGAGKSLIHSNFSGSSLSMWTQSFWGFTGRSFSVIADTHTCIQH